MKNEKVAVYIGRFQPLHDGHVHTIQRAADLYDRVIILVGSAEQARTFKNPFTFDERKKYIECLTERIGNEIRSTGHDVKFNILPIHDYIYNNNKWLGEVQQAVNSVTKSKDIYLTGYQKDNDSSTAYLDYFNWKTDFLPESFTHNDNVLNATDVRDALFSNEESVNTLPVPDEMKRFLTAFLASDHKTFELLQNERLFNNSYKETMQTQLPYPTIPFYTGDSLVVAAGHVLLIRRRTFPGKGLYALPGGFMDGWKDESQVDTALRELHEETRIKVPLAVLRGNIKNVMEFGDFNRSLRWRIITKCVHIQLPDVTLPKVRGSDDADKAFWMPINEITQNRDKFFEDHYDIISLMLGIN